VGVVGWKTAGREEVTGDTTSERGRSASSYPALRSTRSLYLEPGGKFAILRTRACFSPLLPTPALPATRLMNISPPPPNSERQILQDLKGKGIPIRFWTYAQLSGPGWIASAITLGGGSLASSLYLGILGGYSLLWVQPLAMILGVVMLSAIGYVTLSTGERPFRAINQHVSPVLGWGWALAVAAANVVWCMPQHSLAFGVLSQNLFPTFLGPQGTIPAWAATTFGDSTDTGIWLGANFAKLLVGAVLLVLCLAVTWSYDRGGRGIWLYETCLKVIVALIVLCFFGVVVSLAFSSESLDWNVILRGLVPDFGQFFRPATTFEPFLDAVGPVGDTAREFWSAKIVSEQRDVLISAAATAVGINMTFMFPYTMLRRGWTKEFRGLSIFDLSTGMFIPYVLATGFVVIASAARFHTELPDGFTRQINEQGVEIVEVDPEHAKYAEFQRLLETRNSVLAAATQASGVSDTDNSGEASSEAAEPAPAERHLAAMLVHRDAFDLSRALDQLTGSFVANLVFGCGVLAMVLSTISILMLISGFVFAEMMACVPGGKVHRAGTLVAGVGGAMWPLFWVGESQFYLAVVASVFGFMLLPFAYVTFVLLLNSRSLLGEERPSGFRRVVWNLLAGFAALIATLAATYMVWDRARWAGILAVMLYIGLAIMVFINQRNESH
jgi:Mn2+/Fe2+ NRAMP family transporter